MARPFASELNKTSESHSRQGSTRSFTAPGMKAFMSLPRPFGLCRRCGVCLELRQKKRELIGIDTDAALLRNGSRHAKIANLPQSHNVSTAR